MGAIWCDEREANGLRGAHHPAKDPVGLLCAAVGRANTQTPKATCHWTQRRSMRGDGDKDTQDKWKCIVLYCFVTRYKIIVGKSVGLSSQSNADVHYIMYWQMDLIRFVVAVLFSNLTLNSIIHNCTLRPSFVICSFFFFGFWSCLYSCLYIWFSMCCT